MMKAILPAAAFGVLGCFVVACSNPSAPSGAAEAPVATVASAAAVGPPALPAWILNPVVVPKGRQGKNNCTFALGPNAASGIWNFHPDGACWEHGGPDGWTRQHQNVIHVPSHAACEGGPADVSPIRICRPGGAGQPTPCGTTGPLGCAICVRSVVCH
jgi:hypothetical protein